jgi:hypothetical protein
MSQDTVTNVRVPNRSLLLKQKINLKLSLYLMKDQAMETDGKVKVEFRAFLTSALHGTVLPASRPDRFIPGETAPDTHIIGGSVDPRADLDLLPLPNIEP